MGADRTAATRGPAAFLTRDYDPRAALTLAILTLRDNAAPSNDSTFGTFNRAVRRTAPTDCLPATAETYGCLTERH